MLVRDMLFDKRSSFEQLVTSLTSKFALILLLDVLLSRFTQFSAKEGQYRGQDFDDKITHSS